MTDAKTNADAYRYVPSAKMDVILFHDFETLDVFGPVQVIGSLDPVANIDTDIQFYSQGGGLVSSRQGVKVDTLPTSEISEPYLLLVPGGMGVRREVKNPVLLSVLEELCSTAQVVMTVCTGTALLARAGVLKGRRATSNKSVLKWVSQQDPDVRWVQKARWVKDGKFYTSSGVSAGMDMTLDIVSDIWGGETADGICRYMEYTWDRNSENDPFYSV